jgi:hypothetical protein
MGYAGCRRDHHPRRPPGADPTPISPSDPVYSSAPLEKYDTGYNNIVSKGIVEAHAVFGVVQSHQWGVYPFHTYLYPRLDAVILIHYRRMVRRCFHLEGWCDGSDASKISYELRLAVVQANGASIKGGTWFETGAEMLDGGTLDYFAVPWAVVGNPLPLVAVVAIEVLLMGAVEKFRKSGTGPGGYSPGVGKFDETIFDGLDNLYPGMPHTPASDDVLSHHQFHLFIELGEGGACAQDLGSRSTGDKELELEQG